MKRPWPIVGVLGLILPTLYVLSEAPLLRLTGTDAAVGGFWRLYEPTDRLYMSPLAPPLRAWAELWGSKNAVVKGVLARRMSAWLLED